jgi:hypothetical protein
MSQVFDFRNFYKSSYHAPDYPGGVISIFLNSRRYSQLKGTVSLDGFGI